MIDILWSYLCLVFFFKQKTAYEMRISDWSSDVCSSDLWLFARESLNARDADSRPYRPRCRPARRDRARRWPRRRSRPYTGGAARGADRRRHCRKTGEDGTPADQIGSASGRERGCQEVEISVVCGTLITHTKQNAYTYAVHQRT